MVYIYFDNTSTSTPFVQLSLVKSFHAALDLAPVSGLRRGYEKPVSKSTLVPGSVDVHVESHDGPVRLPFTPEEFAKLFERAAASGEALNLTKDNFDGIRYFLKYGTVGRDKAPKF